MRRFLISLLLTGAAATPAIAAPDWSSRQHVREDRQQAREERQSARTEAREQRSAEAPASVDRRSEPQMQVREPSVDRSSFARSDRSADIDALRAGREARRDSIGTLGRERIEEVQPRFQERQQGLRDARQLRQSNRPLPNVMRNPHPLVVSETPRPGTQPPLRSDVHRSTPTVQWNTAWRNNSRYDWQNHRHHHRSLFHLGFYFDPFGWNYYPYQIGWRMWPSYYSSRYWINDPWYYRLPYAPAGYRWIRYWNDALLVDTWTGEVVDVIPSFFW